MRKFINICLLILLHLSLPLAAWAQMDDTDPFNNQSMDGTNTFGPDGQQKKMTWGRDTTKTDKTVPTEFHQWRLDERLGTILPEQYNDTLPHAFQNFNATDGPRGEYIILGNLGSPRYAINFLDRPLIDDLMFIQPYDYFHTSVGSLLFTNTKSPLTNLQYHKAGTKQNGQDRFRAYFATNINKQAGMGFKIDYLYGRGYYNNQANSQFGGTVFGYYQGEIYEMHAMASWEHMKMAENGGITNDTYITDPESFPRKVGSRDIPTVLSSVWNRNDHQTYYLTHRLNAGVYHDIEVPDSLKPVMPGEDELFSRIKSDSLREVIKEDTVRYTLVIDSLKQQWTSEQVTPREFIPITSFIHTLNVRRLTHDNYSRGSLPNNYFSHAPYYRSAYGSFTDETRALSVKNTLGVQLREGFNKWAKAGITLFAAHELRHYTLPDSLTTDTSSVWNRYTENHISVGGELQKMMGRLLHYRVGAEFWVIGPDAGDLDIYGNGDLNFRLGRDTVHLAATASFKNVGAPFYLEHYHSQTTWWDHSFGQETHTRIEGKLSIDRTHTSLRFGVENISNYLYLTNILTPIYAEGSEDISGYSRDVDVRQQSGSIQVLSATLQQDFHFGIFHWDNTATWQKSSKQDVLPLPTISIYTNPYLRFHLAKVLGVEIGADMRFYTKYYAPDYAPFVNQFAIQDASQTRMKIGGNPLAHAYINFDIKRVRGYIQYTNFIGARKNAFWAPHYPIDPAGLHFGISWNFYD